MKYCTGCGVPRKEEKAFCGGCGSAFAGGGQKTTSTSGGAKGRATFVVAALAIVAIAAGVWFFVGGSGPSTMDEYREQTAQLWEEYFSIAPIPDVAEWYAWGQDHDCVVDGLPQAILEQVNARFESQIEILNQIKDIPFPGDLSDREQDTLISFFDNTMIILEAQRAFSADVLEGLDEYHSGDISAYEAYEHFRLSAIEHGMNGVFPRDQISSSFGLWIYFDELSSDDYTLTPVGLDVEEIAQEMEWLSFANDFIKFFFLGADPCDEITVMTPFAIGVFLSSLSLELTWLDGFWDG